ncbi:MAG: GNAT family N-acyltransferase [Vicinamibacterales bacterium]
MDAGPVGLDGVAAGLVARAGLRFAVAGDEVARDAAYRLRAQAVVDSGWQPASDFPDGREHDAYDDRAVHIVGWDGGDIVATGRIVLPPGPLPTEAACGRTIEPAGRVADVGRMAVARAYQDTRHPAFVALLARLYLEVRARGFDLACGMMSPRARSLLRLLGVRLEVLGDDRPYCGDARAPVRFSLVENDLPLSTRWRAPSPPATPAP